MPERNEALEDGAGRAFWSGTVSFGLVSVPVDLLPAHTSARAALRMLDADGTPLARRYHCPADGEELAPEQLVRGRELDGQWVVVSDEELEALAPEKSREIDLRRFVDRDSIDPMFFERSYFLAPGKGSGKAYRLLAAVMERSRRAGIASFVMRDKEYLIAIFAEDGLLRGETLRFAEQVRSVRSVGLPKPARVDAAAVERMSRAVSALAAKSWDPGALRARHEAIRKLAERKYERGKDVVRLGAAARDEGEEIIDLMQVLRDSLAQNDLAAKSPRRRAAKRRTASARGAAKRTSAGRSGSKPSGTARSGSKRGAAKRSGPRRSGSQRSGSGRSGSSSSATKKRPSRAASSAAAKRRRRPRAASHAAPSAAARRR